MVLSATPRAVRSDVSFAGVRARAMHGVAGVEGCG